MPPCQCTLGMYYATSMITAGSSMGDTGVTFIRWTPCLWSLSAAYSLRRTSKLPRSSMPSTMVTLMSRARSLSILIRSCQVSAILNISEGVADLW